MKKASFDAKTTYIRSPLRLILFMCRHLLDQGYGTLRFYSYIKEGLEALRVAMYFELVERGRNGERLALDPFCLTSFSGFEQSNWSLLNDCVRDGLSVDGAASKFAIKHCNPFGKWHLPPDHAYVDWLDGVINVCHDDGFPITESPGRASFKGGNPLVNIVFAHRRGREIFINRPPGFDATVFPYREYDFFLAEEARAKEEKRLKNNYEQWKARVAEIQRRSEK